MLVEVAHRYLHVLCTGGWPTVYGVRAQACCHVSMHQQRLCPRLLPQETVCRSITFLSRALLSLAAPCQMTAAAACQSICTCRHLGSLVYYPASCQINANRCSHIHSSHMQAAPGTAMLAWSTSRAVPSPWCPTLWAFQGSITARTTAGAGSLRRVTQPTGLP